MGRLLVFTLLLSLSSCGDKKNDDSSLVSPPVQDNPGITYDIHAKQIPELCEKINTLPNIEFKEFDNCPGAEIEEYFCGNVYWKKSNIEFEHFGTECYNYQAYTENYHCQKTICSEDL